MYIIVHPCGFLEYDSYDLNNSTESAGWFSEFTDRLFSSEHPDEFRFTSQGKAPVIDNMDDSETFYEMSEGLFNLGITEEQQLFLFSVLAAVLHMGDIQFNEERNDSCSISVSTMCSKWAFDASLIHFTLLCNYQIVFDFSRVVGEVQWNCQSKSAIYIIGTRKDFSLRQRYCSLCIQQFCARIWSCCAL